MTHRVEDAASQIRSLFVLGAPSGLTDAQLLNRFETGDGTASGLAFEALIERHGPMVLRVCRGVLSDPHDAQDAFQATFLILVRKVNSIRDRDSLASWLHGVALRVANHARSTKVRQRRLERETGERTGPPPMIEATHDLGPTLHEEIGRLPERYRSAVVLCYLEGHTCEDAARVLRWPVGTVKSRLSRARERLRTRLTRLGLAPEPVLEAPTGPRSVAPLALSMVKATAEAAIRFGARSSAMSSVPVALAEGVLKAMTLAKLKFSAFALLIAASSLGASAVISMGQAPRVTPSPQSPPARALDRGPNADDPIALMIPRDLKAIAGNGTILMYALDEKGERIVDDRAMKVIEAREARKKGSTDLIAHKAAGPWKETDVDLRWAAITGTLDHQAIREAVARSRTIELSEADPDYKRVDIQRQTRSPEGTWSDWTDLDQNRNYQILDNIPEVSFERIPEEYRLTAFVDPLPFLKKGSWNGVDPEVLLKLPIAEPRPGGIRVTKGSMTGAATRKPVPPLLMIRSLDFTVEPGTTYVYRVRVVVANPDLARTRNDRPLVTSRQAAREKRELFGPWSEPSQRVKVP